MSNEHIYILIKMKSDRHSVISLLFLGELWTCVISGVAVRCGLKLGKY